MRKLVMILSSTLCMLALAGCGFHLRGQATLPPDMAVTYISGGNPFSELGRSLRRDLELNGVTVTSNQAEAKATLAILSERTLRRTLAATRRDTLRQYTLTYNVDYAVNRADGSVLVPRETLTVTRDLLYDEAQVLGRDAGEEIVLRDLAADATRSILLRLQAAATP